MTVSVFFFFFRSHSFFYGVVKKCGKFRIEPKMRQMKTRTKPKKKNALTISKTKNLTPFCDEFGAEFLYRKCYEKQNEIGCWCDHC